MGSSGNWFKLFIHHRKSNPNDQEKVLGGKRNKKWKLWRSSSSSESSDQSRLSVKREQVAASVSSDSPVIDDVYNAAMATLVRAPPKDFLVIRQEWAAIRIQTAFRALLARRAFRALKAIVRLQAVVRGWLVRKQAAMTLKCMQALVRAQAQVKAHRLRISLEEDSVSKEVDNQSDLLKQEEGKWCDSRGSIDEVKIKQQMRQEASIKRERAMAYYISQQQLRPNNKLEKSSSSEWSWLIESSRANSKTRVNTRATSSNSYCSSSSQLSSRVLNTESSFTSSTAACDAIEDSASSASVSLSKPRYMNLTTSNRAKQREISKSRLREVPPLGQHYVKSGLRFSGEMTRNSVDSAGPCSVVVHSKDLYSRHELSTRCR